VLPLLSPAGYFSYSENFQKKKNSSREVSLSFPAELKGDIFLIGQRV
jgi:hypothetical protein